nr:F58 [uncultured bacterium]
MASLYDVPLKRIDGSPDNLGRYKGQVLLIVNVASKCGLTPQYAALEKLYRDKHAQGLEVLGFPTNDFNGQEPGSDAEISAFCSTIYDVHFPMFSKIVVTGPEKHPLYARLNAARPAAIGDGPLRERFKTRGVTPSEPPEVLWNFEKFLIDRQGKVVARFAPDVTPDDPRLTSAVDAELARD